MNKVNMYQINLFYQIKNLEISCFFNSKGYEPSFFIRASTSSSFQLYCNILDDTPAGIIQKRLNGHLKLYY